MTKIQLLVLTNALYGINDKIYFSLKGVMLDKKTHSEMAKKYKYTRTEIKRFELAVKNMAAEFDEIIKKSTNYLTALELIASTFIPAKSDKKALWVQAMVARCSVYNLQSDAEAERQYQLPKNTIGKKMVLLKKRLEVFNGYRRNDLVLDDDANNELKTLFKSRTAHEIVSDICLEISQKEKELQSLRQVITLLE